MENLLQKDPTVNVVYTINEPAAAGAYEALKAVGREKDVIIVSVDGGCPGVKERRGRRDRRHLAAISAADGLDGCAGRGGLCQDQARRSENSPGLDFFNTGVELITDKPVDGVPSISVEGWPRQVLGLIVRTASA